MKRAVVIGLCLFLSGVSDATTLFIESGTDATQDLTFWSSTSGAASSSSAQSYTGPRSVLLDTGAGPVTAAVVRNSAVQDAGTCFSFYVRFSATPTVAGGFAQTRTSGAASIFFLQLNTDNTISLLGPTTVNGTTVLSNNTWYRISVSYTITNTTTFRIDTYINGVREFSATAGTLPATVSNQLRLIANSVWGANKTMNIDNIYVDNRSDYTDCGNVLVTAKRPNANGTTNGFTTQIGAGGSGYGSGHSPQVNEQPLSTTNGWSMVGAGSAVTEEYNIEGASVGDAPVKTIVDYAGWLYAKALTTETATMILNNASFANVALTTTNTMFTNFAASTVYPSGTGTDIGIVTTTALTTVSLYESGIVFAYKELAGDCSQPFCGVL